MRSAARFDDTDQRWSEMHAVAENVDGVATGVYIRI